MENKEKIAFLKTLFYIAVNDDELTEAEENYFFELGKSFDLTEEEVTEIKYEMYFHIETLEDIVSGIKSDDTKELLINELLSLCFIDNNYSEEERQGILIICELMKFDVNRFAKIESNFKKEHRLKLVNNFVKKTLETGKSTLLSLGNKIQADSKVVSKSVSKGVKSINNKISSTLEITRKTKEENEALREKLKNNNVTESIKQKIILQLNNKILNLTTQLKIEKERKDKNEEMIELLQMQIIELTKTKEVAENIQTA